MHVNKIVSQLLKEVIHKTRITSLIPVLLALIKSKQLRLTELGRALDTPGKERAGIRRIDRLLGNVYYQKNAVAIYRVLTQRIVCNQGRPVILVDWTGVPNSKRTATAGEHCALRATLLAPGRSITFYEEVHPKSKENSPLVHRSFLKTLSSLLPRECRPYVVTDAGFKNPWFIAVSSLGWDYIGRVRGKVNYDEGKGFQSVKNLFAKASSIPKYLGSFILAEKNPLKTNGYIYTHPLKGRKKRTKTGKVDKHKDSLNYSNSYREPWLLVSSLNSYSAAQRVVNIYRCRMTIEGSFRDTKSVAFGLSMNDNMTIKAERYTVWFMLAALASFVAWVVGYAAEKQGLHYSFQANTYRHRRVLSFFYLGCQIIRKNVPLNISLEDIQREAWDSIAWEILS